MSLQAFNLGKYWHVWQITATNALQEAFVNRATNLLFLSGKALRLTVVLSVLILIKNTVSSIGGYSSDQVLVFFLTYQILDTLAQIAYRGVYNFSSMIRTGEFDFFLTKPINPLFRALTGLPDINDSLFFFPTLVVIIYLFSTLSLVITPISVVLYILLLINGFLIATSLHILVLSLGILTTEIDNVIWMYRDLTRMGQFPISFYRQPMRFALFFIVPIGFMLSVPAEVLVSLSPSHHIALTMGIGLLFFWGSLKVWKYSLRYYSSASS